MIAVTPPLLAHHLARDDDEGMWMCGHLFHDSSRMYWLPADAEQCVPAGFYCASCCTRHLAAGSAQRPPDQPRATDEVTYMRGAVAGFVDALRELPPDMRVLGASEAVLLVVSASYPSELVANTVARICEALPGMVARYESTIAADKGSILGEVA